MKDYLILSVLVLVLSGCADGNNTNVELIRDMFVSPALKAQDSDSRTKSGSGMRIPPEGTLPIGFQRYPYSAAEADKAESELKNPFSEDSSIGTLELGKKKYDIYCGICHGSSGKGDGAVAEKMPLRPPSLITEKVRGFQDGRIFHIITRGQGVMGGYSTQITDRKARWAVVNYIRSLQKLNN